jgi:CDP-glycerol glycerophosphotransferase (TagB/SpsB family)
MKLLLSILLGIFSYIVPKKKNLIAFLPWHDPWKFKGNVKNLFIYIFDYSNKFETVWITKDKNTIKNLNALNYPVTVNKFSIFWNLLRARNIVIDGTINWLSFGRFKFIQLWHGTGFKHVGLLNQHLSGINYVINENHYAKYSLIIATSEIDKEFMRDSFNNDNVKITGTPRVDEFLIKFRFKNRFKENFQLAQFNNIILYAPTFRDVGEFNPFSRNFLEQLHEWLLDNNYLFLLKRHPYESKSKIIKNKYSNIRDITLNGFDNHELLSITDVLISDYSSIPTDFVLCEKPVIFYTYDYLDYLKNCRSFYYNLKEILPGPFVENEEELLDYMKNLEWFNDEQYQLKYQKFINNFHKYTDGESCKRILSEINSLK